MVIKEEKMIKRIRYRCKYCQRLFEDENEAENHELECAELGGKMNES